MESFDHEATNAQLLAGKWNGVSGGSFVAGRFGNGWGNSKSQGLRKTFPDSQGTWIVGFAFYLNTYINGRFFIGWQDGSSYQDELRFDGIGRIYATRNGTYLATGTLSLGYSRWYYIEWKLIIDGTNGLSEVVINGQTDLTFTGNTKGATPTTANQLFFDSHYAAGPDNGNNFRLDDIYVCDGQTGAGSNPCNDYLGDSKTVALYPNGNGAHSDFVGSDGNSTDNYLLVDETTPNDDTDYVASATVNAEDTYTYTDLSGTGTVFGVQALPYVRKTDAGARTMKSVARLSSTEVDGAEKAPGTTYAYYPQIFDIKPGGGDWTITDVNNAEFGRKVFS